MYGSIDVLKQQKQQGIKKMNENSKKKEIIQYAQLILTILYLHDIIKQNSAFVERCNP